MTEESTNREGKKPRRGKGEGSITQRKDGTWQGMLDLGFSGGKRQRKYVYGKTKTEAGRKLRALREHMQQNSQAEDQQAEQTVAEYINDWYAMYFAGKRAATTCKLNRDQIDQHIIPGLGHIELKMLRTHHIQQWVNALYKTPCRRRHENQQKDPGLLSQRTVEIILGVLSKALNRAVQSGIIPTNPATFVELGADPANEYEPRVLLDEEVALVLDAMKEHRLEALYHLLICLGLRRKEVLELEWRDLHLDTDDTRLVIRKSKTRAGRRTLPLSDELVASLRTHRERQQYEQVVFGPAWNSGGLVFPSEVGSPILGGNLYRQFKAILRKVGVEEKVRHDAGSAPDTLEKATSIRIHDLRHWACSVMLRDGTPIKEVQELMGHATVITTLKIYAHTIGEGKRQAVGRISRILNRDG
jgi:integrase